MSLDKQTARRLIVTLAFIIAYRPVTTTIAGSPTGRAVIFLNDRSSSFDLLNPPDTTQAMIVQFLELIGLAGEQTKVALVQFGGADNLSVIAGDDGLPTAATASLKHRVLKDFPNAAGATPMDLAFEVAQGMVGKMPPSTIVTAVLTSDGHPESGRLRPKDFAEVAKEMERQRTALLERCRSRGYPDKIVQACLQEQEQAWSDPTTKEFVDLYRKIQLPAEFQKVLQCAAALAKSKVEFVTVDFAGGIPELRKIHQAANGPPRNYVVSKPDEIIRNVHALGLTELPGVVRQDVREFPADAQGFAAEIPVPLDPLAGRNVVTFQFHPAIAGFQKHLKVSATTAEGTVELSMDNSDERFTLAVDGKQQLATATLVVDAPAGGGQVSLHLESPDKSLHIPPVTVYTHFRLRDGLEGDFRPLHAEPSATGPFQVSATHSAAWKFGLVARDTAKAQSLKTVDAQLRNTRTAEEVTVHLRADPQTVGQFVSDPVKLPVGEYDVVVQLVTETGATFRLTLTRHVESAFKDESASLQIRFSPDGEMEGTSCSPTHIDFGVLGDAVNQRTVEVTVRTRDIDYPIVAIPRIDLADPSGHVVPEGWIRFNRGKLQLSPGRAEKLRVTLVLPAAFDEILDDGRFTGQLTLTRAGLQDALDLKPFEKISGADDSEPINRVAFTLSRPQPRLHSCWAGREWLKRHADGRLELPVSIAIGVPLVREVVIDVTNTSSTPRTIRVLPGGKLTDASGNTVLGLQLVPREETETACEVASGATARWAFDFRADPSIPLSNAFGAFHVTGDGLRPQLISVPIRLRRPLLGPQLRGWAIGSAAVFSLLLIGGLVSLRTHRRLATGRSVVFSSKRPWPGLATVTAGDSGAVHLIPQTDVHVTFPNERRARWINAHQPIPVPTETTSDEPVRLELVDESTQEPRVVEIHDVIVSDTGDAHVRATIAQGGPSDRLARRTMRRVLAATAIVAGCLTVATTLHLPGTLGVAQRFYDALFPNR